MKKIVLIPDSFKGTMSSAEICSIMEEQILRHCPAAEIVSLPVADGGEGSVDAFLKAVGGEKVDVASKGPFMEDITSFYGLLKDGTAVIEMAACAGLPLVGNNLLVERTTTYGVGLLILDALDRGCRNIIMALGGSATNDFGMGAAAAVGYRFLDQEKNSFIPTGGTLGKVVSIDTSGVDPRLKETRVISMCDIDNPLYGESGAAHIFGPQKGATPEMVLTLDENMKKAAHTVEEELGKMVSQLPGSGAAGGMGGGMVAFFDSQLQMGIEAVLNTVHFDDILPETSLVFTGEGKLDTQSLRGKVVLGVARRAQKLKVPVIAIVGDIGDNIEQVYEEGLSGVFSINRVAVEFSKAKLRSKKDLALTMDNVIRFMKKIGHLN